MDKKQQIQTAFRILKKLNHSAWNDNVWLVCPHCKERGRVVHRVIEVKRGISGGKATGAVLTGGLSLLATGLSKKGKVNEFKCKNCGITWTS